jgi:hypothetical protein
MLPLPHRAICLACILNPSFCLMHWQPLSFAFVEDSASLAFPDVLLLEAGKVVKLGVMRQVSPGDVSFASQSA